VSAGDGGSKPPAGGGPEQQLEALYERLARDAARLLVVNEAGRILRSTSDPEELAAELLKAICEAVFSKSGCVARIHDEDLEILATHGLQEDEADALATDQAEAAVWFDVASAEGPRTSAELAETVDWPEPDVEDEETEPWETESDEGPKPSFGLYIPLTAEEQTIGVLALGERADRQPFQPGDTELAVSLAAQLAVALSSAELFAEKERRIEQLQVLLRISKEITSTLDLDRMLGIIANMLSMVVPNRRTTVALAAGTSVTIRASSDPDFNVKQAEKDPLLPALRWAHGAGESINTSRIELEADDEADGRELLLPVVSADGGARGLAILPLRDEEGALGLLAIESDADAPPLEGDDEELVTILANQTTVAIRNAELYQRMPGIRFLEPVLGKKRGRSGLAPRRRWIRRAVFGAVVLLLLVPLPDWVPGDAEVRPTTLIAVRAATEGTLDEVLVSEGQRVRAGDVLARMRKDELQLQLEQVGAAIQRARAEAGSARQRGELATYRAQQAEQARLSDEQVFVRAELDRTELVAPHDGIVLTPRVELLDGKRLARGDTFLEMASLERMDVEISVREDRVNEIEPGMIGRLRVHAYPGKTFRGQVVRVAPRADDRRRFRVVVAVENADGELRPGMTGTARVDTSWRPVLFRLLRPAARWLRFKLWV